MTKKNLYTTILGFVIAGMTSVNAYLQTVPEGGEINFMTLAVGLLTAVIAFYTGAKDK